MALAPEQTGIGIRRHFTRADVHPYDEVEWARRDARITNWADGSVAFEQLGVEFPTDWSVNATNIVAQKYFRGTLGTAERESSLRQVIDRVADTITTWGTEGGYFVDTDEAETFRAELKHLLVTQKAAFNSPVWFNIGVPGVPQQASACFILAVDDAMDSILNWYREEGTIFKGGSGAGVNLSKIRSSVEHLKGGGTASGPVSFMRGADASAGTIKSGGKTRRAAKMVILDVSHPDVEEFIWVKAREEKKIRVLEEAGFDMSLDGKDMASVQYQNANNSVRVTDEFMQAVVDDADWHLRAVTTGEVVRTTKARDLMRQFAQATWECADPGMQYDTTINRWHTAANTGRINASNPCSEYVHLDNSACNLASVNLLEFLHDGVFDVAGFKQACAVMFTGQEILVGRADYPTEPIGENARKFRQLGLGYANLGALLMAIGAPYDSARGRAWAGAITSLMTGHAYEVSARTAARMGPFAGYAENAEPMLRVLDMHRTAAADIDEELVPSEILGSAQQSWDEACDLAGQFGVRNSQASVIAPTGTIALMMDCDTTGVEPDLGLVKTKKLVGGGTMSIVNQTVPRALRNLGYDESAIAEIVAYVDENKTIVGAPALNPDHLGVFACSMGDNTIHYLGHVKMMAAVQPAISGAISKCVTGETLLPTADGLVRIGSLRRDEAPDSFRDEVLEVASLGETQKTDAFYYGGTRDTLDVTLRSGHRVTATPNHRLLVAGDGGLDWRRTDELEVGDMVATKYGSELWATTPPLLGDFVPSALYGCQKRVTLPNEMTSDLAFLLGAIASEGHITRSNWTVHVTNSVPAVRERVAAAWTSLFGIDARIVDDGVRCPSVVIASKTVVELLDHWGVGGRASEKRIPDVVLRSPREMVLAFLQGLALDAYTTSGAMAKWAICLDSPELLDDLQAVLTNLGIVHGRITKHNTTYDKDYDEVYACGVHAQHLVRLVPFLEPDKAAAASRLAERAMLDHHATSDVVPGISPRELYELLPGGRGGQRGHNVRTEFAYLCDPRTRRVSRRSVERVAAVPGVVLPSWLGTVIEDDLHFSPVTAVEAGGEREVFDVSVPANHAFVGNGIVNHNTVNMPTEASVEDVEQLHIDAWQMGVKAIAIYRDGCKVSQPLSMTKKDDATDAPGAGEVVERVVEKVVEKVITVKEPVRKKLPRSRASRTFEFRVADCKGFVSVGQYEDGRPGEIFIRISKQGSTLAGIMDAFAVSVSYGLQYGVPLRAYVETFTNTRFEPAGMTDDPDIRIASSLVDYMFRRLAVEYLSYEERAELGILTVSERTQPTLPGVEETVTETVQGSDTFADPKSVPSASDLARELEDGGKNQPSLLERAGVTDAETAPIREAPQVQPQVRASDAPYCMQCGVQMVRAGSCHACPSCGSTSGCS